MATGDEEEGWATEDAEAFGVLSASSLTVTAVGEEDSAPPGVVRSLSPLWPDFVHFSDRVAPL